MEDQDRGDVWPCRLRWSGQSTGEHWWHPSLLTPHSSPLTPHSSPLTPHPSLLTPHPSLLTPHSSPAAPVLAVGLTNGQLLLLHCPLLPVVCRRSREGRGEEVPPPPPLQLAMLWSVADEVPVRHIAWQDTHHHQQPASAALWLVFSKGTTLVAMPALSPSSSSSTTSAQSHIFIHGTHSSAVSGNTYVNVSQGFIQGGEDLGYPPPKAFPPPKSIQY